MPLTGVPIHLVGKSEPDFNSLRSETFQHVVNLTRNGRGDIREPNVSRHDRWYEYSARLHDVFLDAIELFAGVRKPRHLRVVSIAVLSEQRIETSDDDEILRASLFASPPVDSRHRCRLSTGTTVRRKAPIDSFVALHATEGKIIACASILDRVRIGCLHFQWVQHVRTLPSNIEAQLTSMIPIIKAESSNFIFLTSNINKFWCIVSLEKVFCVRGQRMMSGKHTDLWWES